MNRMLLLLCLLAGPLLLSAQSLPIAGPWAFHTGDDPLRADPNFEDITWPSIQPGTPWEEQGVGDYNGVAWYRKRITIPLSMKRQLDHGLLLLSLGLIDDDDQTFVNGQLVGETHGYTLPRRYALPDSLIRWDAENVIAVRVTDGAGKGGLYGPVLPSLRRPQLTDYLAFSIQNAQPVGPVPVVIEPVGYGLAWQNTAMTPVSGTLTATVSDLTGRVLNRETKPLTVAPGASAQTETYRVAKPMPVRVTAVFRVGADSLTGSMLVGAAPVTYGPVRSPLRACKVPERFVPIPFEQQHVGGWLGERINRNLTERLLKVDEAGLLAGYVNRPGTQDWIGEHVGKYLETAANTYRYSHNAALKIQMDRMVQHLIACQRPDGYLGTYTPDKYWTSWDVWMHKYNLVGLLAYYNLTGYEPALTACRRMGDLLCRTFGPGRRDIIASGTHVGMAATSILDPMTDLYRQTGNPNYLAFCKYLIASYNQPNGPKIVATLTATGRVDKTANAKAYELLSNVVGLVKYHKLTGEAAPLTAALAAWRDITAHRLYVTGSASSFEHFLGNDELPAEADKHIGEGCVTTTWMQLNQQLLTLTGEMKYLTELEKSAYNHLTGAENPQTGCVSYYTPLMGKKPFDCTITCCTSSIPRGIALIPTFTAGRLNGEPVMLLYQAGTYKTSFRTTNGTTQAVDLMAVTDFPQSGQITYTVRTSKPVRGVLAFRVPVWCRDFQLNGLPVKAETGYARLERIWANGDLVQVSFEMPTVVLPGGSSYPGRIGFRRGPQVLSLDAALNKLVVEPTAVQVPPGPLPAPVPATLPVGWVGTQTYGLLTRIGNRPQTLVLVPYADAGQTGGASAVWLKQP